MKLRSITEARYHGAYEIDDVYRQFRKIADEYAYKETYNDQEADIFDAGARTMRRDDQTAVGLHLVFNRRLMSPQQAESRFKDLLKYEGVPYTRIERIETNSRFRVYLEAVYIPKPLKEARYAFPNHANEIKQAIEAGKDATIRFDLDQFDEIVGSLKDVFGDNLQLVDETSEEEGQGLRRTVFHLYLDPHGRERHNRWTISVGAYYPTRRAFIRATKYKDSLTEAEYADQGMPRELKRIIIGAGDQPAFRRGIQHPDKFGAIQYHNWLEDNAEHIEMLYHQIKNQGQFTNPGNLSWSAWQHFNPSLIDYVGGASSPQMKNQYRGQLAKLSDLIFDYLRNENE